MNKQIFRKEALDRMSSPEQLDELMPVTSPRGWIALAGLLVLLVLAVLWGFVGRIETTVEGSGALVRPGAVYPIESSDRGIVEAVFVEPEQEVKTGDKLVEMSVEGADKKSTRKIVRAEESGRVLAIAVIKGDPVKKNAVLLTMEAQTKPLQAIIYVPTKDGYKVTKEKPVLVHAATGGQPIFGVVRSAGRFPVTRTAIERSLQNPDWGGELLQQGPVLEVVVDLKPRGEAETETLNKILSGTPCLATITISRRKPVSFVLPIFQ